MLHIFRHITKTALPGLLALAMMLTGCIYDDAPNCPVGDGDENGSGVTLEFKMVTRNADSRSASRGIIGPDTPEQGFSAENYLDLDNLLFLLFDDEQTLLRVFRPDVTVDDIGDYIKYTVRAFLFDDYFLNAADNTNLTFTIVVVGNYADLSPQNIAYHPGQKLSEIFAAGTVGTFVMPVTNNTSNAWIPSVFGGTYEYSAPAATGGTASTQLSAAHIPMAGMQTYTVAVNDLKASTSDAPLHLSPESGNNDIFMLRALAKIEIWDRIGVTGTTQPPVSDRCWLESAELLGHTERGSIFPALEQWNKTGHGYETQYVSWPSIPDNAGFTPLDAPDGKGIVNFFVDNEASREHGCRVLSCYMTEYDPTKVPGNRKQASLRVAIHNPGTTGDDASKVYSVSLAPYIDGAPGANMEIVRNNIYRYEITGVSTGLTLKLIVDPWTSKETVWDYNENPGMADGGYLQWPGVTVNTTDASLQVTNTEVITGTFTFDEPVNGHWYAAFMREDYKTEPDAFVFVDADGNAKESADGIIDGKEATIKIRAKYAPKQNDNRRARLIFTVRTLDGRVVTANVLDGSVYGTNTYFTVIQNAAL